MTIEEELNEESTVAAPQAIGNGVVGSIDGRSDLESLVRTLAEQARKADQRSDDLAERVALLEGGGRCYDANNNTTLDIEDGSDNKISRPKSRRFNRVSFKEEGSSSSSKLNVVSGVPEEYDNDIEEAFDDRITLLERRLENYEEEKVLMTSNDEQKYGLSESTFSLLVTHHPFTVPFAFAVFSVALSISCLCLTLASSISKGTKGNTLAIPAGVDGMVRAAQFLGELYLSCVFLWGGGIVYMLCKD